MKPLRFPKRKYWYRDDGWEIRLGLDWDWLGFSVGISLSKPFSGLGWCGNIFLGFLVIGITTRRGNESDPLQHEV